MKVNITKRLRTVSLIFSVIAICLYLSAGFGFFIWAYFGMEKENVPLVKYSVHLWKIIVGIVLCVLGLISCVFCSFNIKARKDTNRHIALGIYQIILGNPISGICLLCSKGNKKSQR